MAELPPAEPTFPPSLLPYGPLLYVAWADGVLTESEVEGVRLLARQAAAPQLAEPEVLARWLDPGSPPSPEELRDLLRSIRAHATDLDAPERLGLAELGFALARRQDAQPDPKAEAALQLLEDALGIAGEEAVRDLLADEEPPTPPVESAPPPPFDVAAMTARLDAEHAAVFEEVRAMFATGDWRHPGEIPTDAYRDQVLTWLKTLADRGFGRRAYPGVTTPSMDLAPFIASMEALSDFDLSLVIKTGVQFGLFGGSLYFLGTERHHALLPKVASAELLGCYAMTELGHGSNVRALGTTATFDPDGDAWVIHTPDQRARKQYIGNAAVHGQLAVVFAQLVIAGESQGVHALLVPIRDESGQPMPGVRIGDTGHKMGLNGVDNGWLEFDRVRVPRENLLDRLAQVDAQGRYHSPIASPGRRFFAMLGTLVAGRITIACSAVAATRSALTIAIRYGDRRRQFGPAGQPEQPILDYPSHQLRLMPALAGAYAHTFALRELTRLYIARTDETAPRVEVLAAALKATASWAATDTIQTCRECCGGEGYLSVNRFAALKADTDVYTTFEGDNTVLMLLAARGVLTAFREQLGETRFFSVLKHLADRASATLAELDPLSSRVTTTAHLRSADFQAEVLRHRRDQLTWSAAGRLRSYIAGGMDSFDAMLVVQDHLLGVSRATAEHWIHACFSQAVEDTADPALRSQLARLRDLYALERILADQAWFMRHDVIETGKARAIRGQVHALCAEVREVALPLVDAFAIPDAVLAAPIAVG